MNYYDWLCINGDHKEFDKSMIDARIYIEKIVSHISDEKKRTKLLQLMTQLVSIRIDVKRIVDEQSALYIDGDKTV